MDSGATPAIRPYDALRPTVPVKPAGPRVDPPISDAVARVVVPAAACGARNLRMNLRGL